MRAAACLLTVFVFAAAGSAVAQEKHLIDPTPPGSLNPEPLPSLKNPDAPSTPAKELFARKTTPFPGPPRSIGGYFDGCLAGAAALPITGPAWQVMRLSRNRNWGNPQLLRFIERFSGRRHVAAARRADAVRAQEPSNRPRRRHLVYGDARSRAKPRRARVHLGHRGGRTRSARRRSASVDPYAYRTHPHRCAGSGGRSHSSQCRDQEGVVP